MSEHGIQQAEFVGKRFLSIPIDSIIASDAQRAKHTAQIISTIINEPFSTERRKYGSGSFFRPPRGGLQNKQASYTALLREIKRPSDIIGLHQDNPKAVQIRAGMRDHINDPAWHYSDEENFFDAKKRAQESIALLEARQEKNILVITHGAFMRMLVFSLIMKQHLTPELFVILREALLIKNTGITMCGRDPQGAWHLITWNDHAHLG